MRKRLRWSPCLVLIAAAWACKQGTTDPTVTAPLAEARSIRLYEVVTSADWTAHLALITGTTARLKVRLYVADGREITPLPNPIQMTFAFEPSSLASSVTADSATLLQDVTPTGTLGASGDLRVTLTEPATATMKTFGPFQVLVH